MPFGKNYCLSGFVIVGVTFALHVLPARADVSEIGKKLYLENCASCHGTSGKGDGIMTRYLKIRPADLTKLARKNRGVFPYKRVSQVIDGRRSVRAHGEANMPVWGNVFKTLSGAPKDPVKAEEFAAGRTATLTFFLAEMQK
jgi:mono/diheme cytochrome c family protein